VEIVFAYKKYLSKHTTTIALFFTLIIEKTARSMYDTHSTRQGLFYGVVINNFNPDKLLIYRLILLGFQTDTNPLEE
jgi:hypothetical protein